MDSVASPLEELPGRKDHPEPNMPPDMTREHASAWAMDYFEALSHAFCQHPWCSRPGNPSIATRLDGAAFGDERGQKRCREEPMAETAQRGWCPQEVGATSRRKVQWALNQPEDDMLAPGEFWSQGISQKRLKTEATWQRNLERTDTQALWRAHTLKSFNTFPGRSQSKPEQEPHAASVDFWAGTVPHIPRSLEVSLSSWLFNWYVKEYSLNLCTIIGFWWKV